MKLINEFTFACQGFKIFVAEVVGGDSSDSMVDASSRLFSSYFPLLVLFHHCIYDLWVTPLLDDCRAMFNTS